MNIQTPKVFFNDNTSAKDDHYRNAANELWAGDRLEIDDDAAVSVGEGGAWVRAWVWVGNQQDKILLDIA